MSLRAQTKGIAIDICSKRAVSGVNSETSKKTTVISMQIKVPNQYAGK